MRSVIARNLCYCPISQPPATFGTIYDQSSWTNTSDFTLTGSGSLSLSGNFIQASGPSSVLTIPSIGHTCIDRQYQKMVLDIGTVNSSNTGVGLGRKSISTGGIASLTLLLNPFTGAVTMNGASAGSTTAPNSNDIIQMEAEFSLPDGRSTITITNLTQPSIPVFTANYNYIIGFPVTGAAMPNTGNFAIYLNGSASVTIHSYLISSNSEKRTKIWVSGDSKSTGRFATTIPNGWAERTRAKYGHVVNASGGADTTTELLNRVSEITKFTPRRALLEMGSNDQRLGVPEATFEANYTSVVNQLEASGISVYHMLTFPESDINLTVQKNFIQGTFPASRVIDTWTPLVDVDGHSLNPIYWGDDTGLHFNDAGHLVVFNQVTNFFGNYVQ